MAKRPQFEFDDWLYVRMDKSGNGFERARHFFSATPTAKVEETPDGYKVWAADCFPAVRLSAARQRQGKPKS